MNEQQNDNTRDSKDSKVTCSKKKKQKAVESHDCLLGHAV